MRMCVKIIACLVETILLRPPKNRRVNTTNLWCPTVLQLPPDVSLWRLSVRPRSPTDLGQVVGLSCISRRTRHCRRYVHSQGYCRIRSWFRAIATLQDHQTTATVCDTHMWNRVGSLPWAFHGIVWECRGGGYTCDLCGQVCNGRRYICLVLMEQTSYIRNRNCHLFRFLLVDWRWFHRVIFIVRQKSDLAASFLWFLCYMQFSMDFGLYSFLWIFV